LKDRYFELKNLVGAILLLSVVVCGCKKGDQTLGINLLPGVTILKTCLDSTAIITTSIYTDTKIRVDRPIYNLLGSFNDPVFGRTDASFAAQFRILSNPAYQPSALLDAIVLRLTYKKIYGDTISSQTIQVFELANGLDYYSKYLSSYDIKKELASTEPIGSYSFVPKFRTDSLQTDTTLQIVEIPLSTSFGNRLLRINSTEMTSNDKFLSAFKGLYISSTSLNRRGTLFSIYNTQLSTATVETRPMIILHYHDLVLNKDTLFTYHVTDNSANVSSFVHDYTNAWFKPNLDKEINTDSLIYIQPTSGIKSKIFVPSLSTWKDSANYVFNKAILTFHVDTNMSDYKRYPMPKMLYLKVITDTGGEVLTADSISSYYGGVYSSTNATYSFSVTQHLQNLVAGLKKGTLHNNGFVLVPSPTDRNSSAQRVVLKGNGSKWAKPELNITYTRYKE
jgi:Domain of unknown function (DUF4270)